MRTLEPGDRIPEISLKDIEGNVYNLSHYRGKKHLVLIFYPLDGTNGCKHKECKSHDFAQYFGGEEFLILGVSGLSREDYIDSDTIPELNFPVINDHDKSIRKLFGVCLVKLSKFSNVLQSAFGLNSNRITFVTDKEGIIIYKTDDQDKMHCQSDEALKIQLILKKNFNSNN